MGHICLEMLHFLQQYLLQYPLERENVAVPATMMHSLEQHLSGVPFKLNSHDSMVGYVSFQSIKSSMQRPASCSIRR
ncbi:hypothetical protein SAMN05518855_1002319 [Paenibacillus sp. CF384]|nr:hypothetical protein SAMN05518855_1002319 [Paenibacillus sp. CF384]